jgi:PPK2 family polyphosphate:nucleotide phosphotransferase
MQLKLLIHRKVENMKDYRVASKGGIKLSNYSPDDTSVYHNEKDKGKKKLEELNLELESLQGLLYAEGKRRMLVVLQGMDTSGKDGVISHVFEGVNPQGVQVASFKVPTSPEMAHDYLWRIHQKTPGKGEIVIFNRSHYEDVLIVRVHNLVPPEVWKKRYDQIKNFERLLAEEGTVILKFFLHISPEEQAKRFLERLETPEKNWKFNPGDLEERKFWQAYMEAYEDALNKTSTDLAPWYVIPSDRKWYRNLAIASIMVDTLKGMKMSYPTAIVDLETYHKRLLEMTMTGN